MSSDRAAPPPLGPPPRLRVPGFARFPGVDGPTVRASGEHHLPEVSLRLVVEAGSVNEPPEQAGLAALTARLLSEGAAGRSALQMAAWLDRMGASFRATAGYDVAVLSMHTLSGQLDEALEFLAATALDPAFEAEEVTRVRAQRVDELRRRREDPAHRADEVLLRHLFPSHPYGVPPGGRPETVARLDPDAVRGFHRNTYLPAGMTLIACGDLDPDLLAERVETLFAGRRDAGEPEPPADGPPRDAAVRMTLVDRPGSPQSEIRVGGIGIERGSPHEFDVRLMNAVLGEVFNSRLNMKLREEKGWTYGARSSVAMRRAPGPFVARTAVETRVTAAAVSEMLAEIDGMRSRPPDDAELDRARSALTLSLPRRFETAGQIVARVAESVTYGLADEYWLRYGERVRGVTSRGVTEAARRLMDPERLSVVVVGDARIVGSELEARLGSLHGIPWAEEDEG